MPAIPFPNFVGGSSPVSNPFVARERCLNLYPEPAASDGAVNAWHLVPTPGVEVYSATAASNSSPGRALLLANSRLFAVIGHEFIEIQAGGGRVVRGTLVSDAFPATLSGNGTGGHQIFVTSAGGAWVYDTVSTAWTPLSTPGAAHAAVMFGGYTIALDRTRSTIYQSTLLNSLLFNALDSAQRIVAGDPWRQLAVLGKQLYLLGELTSEVWYQADTYPFALAPHPSGAIPYGIAADWSVAQAGDALYWLAKTANQQAVVVRCDGLTPQPVSDFALQHAFGGYARVDDAVGWSYADRAGHEFYVLTFPSANATWVLDVTTGRWHERGTWRADLLSFEAWRPVYHARFNDQSVCLNRTGGDVLMLTEGGYDLDLPIRRIRRAAHLTSRLKRLFVSKFTLHLYAGQGAVTGQGLDPLVELLVSGDGGQTYYSAGTSSAGRLGVYDQFPEWTRLGSSDNFVFELQMSDPTPWRLVDAFVEVR